MKRLKLSRWLAILALAIALVPSTASAQEADTLSISGTFSMDQLFEFQGTVGADLAAVFANDNEHWWTLTLYGVTYSYEAYNVEWITDFGDAYDRGFITYVHATAFDFEFFGPDADVLNEVLSQQLSKGGVKGDAFFELWNGDYFDPYFDLDPEYWGFNGPYGLWFLRLLPPDPYYVGVTFTANNWRTFLFAADEFGYPLVEPQRILAMQTVIHDYRSGNSVAIVSGSDIVDIGSAEPPLPPSLTILDASALEGDKGTSRLDMTVTLSRSSANAVTVKYATTNGTALAMQDYTATSGTLTFQPGQTQATIPIAIKGDRKREQDETFSVRLSNAAGATIADGLATATILNDD